MCWCSKVLIIFSKKLKMNANRWLSTYLVSISMSMEANQDSKLDIFSPQPIHYLFLLQLYSFFILSLSYTHSLSPSLLLSQSNILTLTFSLSLSLSLSLSHSLTHRPLFYLFILLFLPSFLLMSLTHRQRYGSSLSSKSHTHPLSFFLYVKNILSLHLIFL